MRRVILLFPVLAVIACASSAFAQTPASAPPTVTHSSVASGATSGHGYGVGVGAVTMLNGTSGALFTWGSSGGSFHVDGLFGLHRIRRNGNYTTDFSVGGRFWYHLHAASFADFSLGGGVAFTDWTENPGANTPNNHLDVSIEAGGQIRAFIVPNVALLADLGFGATFGNNDNIAIGGQSVTGSASPEGGAEFVMGTLGIAYFFE